MFLEQSSSYCFNFNNTDVGVKECPSSWKYLNESGKCYKAFTEDKNITWMFSQSKCRDNGVSYNLNQQVLQTLEH